MEDVRKERMKRDIINEHKMRSSNNKEAMLDLLEEHLTNFFGLPEGIAKLERNEKQMSYNIFDSYICFDYPSSRIEVRYKNGNQAEAYAGDIIFKSVKPAWEPADGEVVVFELSMLDRFMDMAFTIKH